MKTSLVPVQQCKGQSGKLHSLVSVQPRENGHKAAKATVRLRTPLTVRQKQVSAYQRTVLVPCQALRQGYFKVLFISFAGCWGGEGHSIMEGGETRVEDCL